MGKGKTTCGMVEASSSVGGEWPLRWERTLGRLGDAVQSVGGDRFLAWSGRRFVVTKCRRAKGTKRVANPLGKVGYGGEGVFQLGAHSITLRHGL